MLLVLGKFLVLVGILNSRFIVDAIFEATCSVFDYVLTNIEVFVDKNTHYKCVIC
jgi:hypothetical protein